MTKDTKTIGVKIICAWIFSILFIVGGLGMLISSFISGFLTLIAGILILPPFSKMLEEKANLKITTWLKIIIIFVLLMVAGIFIPSDDVINDNQGGDLRLEDNSNTQTTTQTTTLQTTTPAVEEETDTATMGEKNALSKAKSYLRYTAFSYKGLIEQLEFEEFTNKEAKYGADNCGADWNEQAKLKAQSYLDYSAFSRQGLIDQLLFEGFTQSQAEYGVNAVGY